MQVSSTLSPKLVAGDCATDLFEIAHYLASSRRGPLFLVLLLLAQDEDSVKLRNRNRFQILNEKTDQGPWVNWLFRGTDPQVSNLIQTVTVNRAQDSRKDRTHKTPRWSGGRHVKSRYVES